MTCRDVSGLLPLFFDGELEARQMRAVALHSSRCAECEGELRQIERVQDIVAATLSARVDELDLSQVWPAVKRRIGTIRVPWTQRLRLWSEERDVTRWIGIPALSAAAATVAVVFVLSSGSVTSVTEAPQIAEASPIDNTAIIDSLDSSAENVAVLNEPETNTTVLWVNDDSDYGGEGFPP
jgi:anti-sigma factor RsiW